MFKDYIGYNSRHSKAIIHILLMSCSINLSMVVFTYSEKTDNFYPHLKAFYTPYKRIDATYFSSLTM